MHDSKRLLASAAMVIQIDVPAKATLKLTSSLNDVIIDKNVSNYDDVLHRLLEVMECISWVNACSMVRIPAGGFMSGHQYHQENYFQIKTHKEFYSK